VGARWPGHTAMGRRGPLVSGRCHFFDFFKIFHIQILKFKIVTFPMSKIHQLLHRDSWKHMEQLSLLAEHQIPKGLQVINSGINSNLNLP
jgi:hypothetical protein